MSTGPKCGLVQGERGSRDRVAAPKIRKHRTAGLEGSNSFGKRRERKTQGVVIEPAEFVPYSQSHPNAPAAHRLGNGDRTREDERVAQKNVEDQDAHLNRSRPSGHRDKER